jgi:hypothetical protein
VVEEEKKCKKSAKIFTLTELEPATAVCQTLALPVVLQHPAHEVVVIFYIHILSKSIPQTNLQPLLINNEMDPQSLLILITYKRK